MYNPSHEQPPAPSAGPNPYTTPPATPNPYNPYVAGDPYAPTTMSQHPLAGIQGYPGQQPPGAMPMPPATPQIHTPPRKRRSGISIAIALLALLALIGGGIGFVAYSNNQNGTHASATVTAQTQQATIRARAASTAQFYATGTAIATHYPFSNRLILNDPLKDDSHIAQYGWDNDGTNCLFANGFYHAISVKINTYFSCAALRTNFTNFTFQVQMNIQQGGNGAQGGLIFRGVENNAQFYILFIDTLGNYELDISVNASGSNDRTLQQGKFSNFHTGFNQLNTLGVVANGSSISLYINQQKETLLTDGTYSTGEVGFLSSYGSSKTDVAYRDAQVWLL
jgi:hypothetical protein